MTCHRPTSYNWPRAIPRPPKPIFAFRRKCERTTSRAGYARSHRACVRVAAERAGRSDRANDWHDAGARQDRLAEPGLQHSPPGDARTARRRMKAGESSAVFQSKQRAEKGSREDGKSIANRTQPKLGLNQASKSSIVRGALKSIAMKKFLNKSFYAEPHRRCANGDSTRRRETLNAADAPAR